MSQNVRQSVYCPSIEEFILSFLHWLATSASHLRSAGTLNVPQAYSGGNQAKDNTFADSAGAPGEVGNVTGGQFRYRKLLYVKELF
jgi:hypothetical protein